MTNPSDDSGEDITEFDVYGGGTLWMANYCEDVTRADIYCICGWEDSPKNLQKEMEYCQPLAWAVGWLYSAYRDELISKRDLAESQSPPNRRKIYALDKRIDALPEEPEYNSDEWLLGLSAKEYKRRVVPVIEKWLESEPECGGEGEYLPSSGTAQGAAFDFFEEMGHEILDALGVELVEGDCPGSSYRAAELSGDIKEANRMAKKRESR